MTDVYDMRVYESFLWLATICILQVLRWQAKRIYPDAKAAVFWSWAGIFMGCCWVVVAQIFAIYYFVPDRMPIFIGVNMGLALPWAVVLLAWGVASIVFFLHIQGEALCLIGRWKS